MNGSKTTNGLSVENINWFFKSFNLDD